MKVKLCLPAFVISFMLVFFLVMAMSVFSAPPQEDTTKTTVIETDSVVTYHHVDVLVEAEWGEPEKNEDVTAEVIMKNKEAEKIILSGGDYKTCEVSLIEGIVVKIYNHKTGKLIKTLQKK